MNDLTADELKRLREAAEAESAIPMRVARLELVTYLCDHAAEIEEALRDRERLEWLAEQQTDTIYMDDGRIVDVKSGSVRAAIDAARKESE